ncbi:MAG: hypothetical protein KBD46_01390 [Candidatus Levybacteria bacterium]|nr:hypothetical protein [Candidatus Levybacteria bacterium]
MKTTTQNAFDFRQSPFWKTYMQKIGWQVETIDTVQVYIRQMPFGISFIKIQHPLQKISLKKIDSIAKKYHALVVVIEPNTNTYDEKAFKKNGYQITPMHHAPTATRKIEISKPLKKIISSFSENAKRNIKKAEKNNLIIKTVFTKDDKHNNYFEKFFTLQKSLTDMKKFYAPGYDESKKKYEALKKGSFLVFAYKNLDPIGLKPSRMTTQEPIASVWYGYYNGVVTYLQTGITKDGYRLLANYLLVLEGIKVGKKLKCTVFDFESIYDARYPNEAKRWKGYSEFKSRFHGEEIQFPPAWIKIYNPVFKWFYRLTSSMSS